MSANKGFNLTARLLQESIIKAKNLRANPYILPVSNLDYFGDGLPSHFFYAYRRPPAGDLSTIVSTVRSSLSQTLDNFFPFAGKITHCSKTGEPEILCNNQGARLVEASADVSLANLDLYDLSKTMRSLSLPTCNEFSLNVQVTSFTCGGFSIFWTFDHLLADAYAFVKFLSAWCEIATTKKLSTVFNHDKNVLRPRLFPAYSQVIDQMYVVREKRDYHETLPSNCATKKHLYFVKGSTLESLREASSEDGERRSRMVALSAYLWKLMAKTVNEFEHTKCNLAMIIEGRRWIDGGSGSMSNYIGNVLSLATGEESTTKLKEVSLAYLARVISREISKVANKEHFLDLIDWVECHRPNKMLPRVLYGGEMTIDVSSCHNMPVMSMDFGFGLPTLGFACPGVDRMGPCNVNLISTGQDNGSWFVSALLSPNMVTAIEQDPKHVFEPIRADHLGL